MNVFPRLTAGGAVALLAIGLLAGCTASGTSGGGGSSAGGSAGDARAADAGSSTLQLKGRAGSPVASDRSVTTTGSLDLTARDPIGTAADITGIVRGSGGRIENADEEPGKQPSAHLTARIPSSAFDAALSSIKREGKVRNVTIRATDVTSQVTDYRVRIATLRTSIARLESLLAKASTTTDLVQIESTLTSRETDLERLLGEQKSLADQVAYSTLTIAIHAPALVATGLPTNFGTGFLAGATALLTALAAFVVGFGVALPWLAAAGVLAAAALGVRRLVRRRREPRSA
jgi:hypothetical protein